MKSFDYFFKEAVVSIFRNKVMSFTTIFTLVSSLIIFGISLSFVFNVNSMIHNIRDKYEIVVYLSNDVVDDKIPELTQQIKNIAGVKDAQFYSKQAALDDLKKSFDNSKAFEGFDVDNPLSNSFKVRVSDVKNVSAVTENLAKVAGVERVENASEILQMFTKVTNIIDFVAFWVNVLLWILSIIIVSNMINLSIFARRKEINIMKIVGATDSFIRLPFIIEGAFLGILSGILSVILIMLAYNVISVYVTQYFSALGFISTINMVLPICVAVILSGGILGAFGSAISIKKHLQI